MKSFVVRVMRHTLDLDAGIAFQFRALKNLTYIMRDEQAVYVDIRPFEIALN